MAEAGRRAPPPLGLCDPATRRVRRPETEDGPAAGQGTVRLQLDLSEPDELSSPEFNYGELIQSLQARKDPSGAAPARDPSDPFNDDERERQEMEALAKKFENRYGAPCRKKRRDRVQDLIDIGFGYDESDPFIDNSEAYDELVPASLSTKLGGFYINTGTLQFRVASESEGDEAEGDEGVIKRKKGKEEDEEEKKVKRVHLAPLNVHRPEKKKRKKLMKDSLCLAAMLHRFTKEKAKEEMRRKNVVGVHPSPITWPHHPQNLHSNAQNSDPLLTDLTSDPAVMSLLTSSNESELQDLLSDLDFSVLDAGPQPAAVGRENGQLAVGVGQKMAGVALARGVGLLSPPPLPEGLPQPLVKRIEDLRAASRQFDQEGRKKFFTLDMNNILLDIELQVQEQPPAVRSGVYSHLEAFVPCNKDTLLKRLKKLSLNIQDDRLRTPLLKLKLAVCSVMPEQTARYNMDCLARVAKQQMEDGERNGSEEDEEERPGKRVIGPRKKFIWDDKLRTLLCNLVRVKLKCYEQEKSSLSVEDYLKAFMENEVKPLWPKGWMQARMLFKESRTVHGHLTDLGKKRIVQPPKPAKVKWNQQPIQALGPSAFPAVPGPVRPPLSPTSEPICLSDSLDDDLATNSLDSIAQALSLLSNAANGVTVNSATTAASCSPPAVSTHLSSLVSHAETLPTTSLASSTHPSTPQPSSARVELTTQPAKPRPPPTASPLLPPQQKLFGTSVNSHAPLQNSKIPQQVARVPSSPCQSPTPHSPQGKVQTQTSPLVHHQPGFITPMQATITKSSHSSSSSPIIKLSHRPPIMTPPLQYSPKSPGFRPPFNINPAGKPAAQQVSYSFAGAQKSTSPLGGTSASITNPSPKATLQPAGFQDSNPSPSAVSANHGQRQRPVGGASQSAKSSASRMPTLGLTSPSDAQVSSSAGGNLLSSVGAPLPLSFGMLGGLVPVSLPFQFPSLLNFTPPGPASTGGASPTPNSGYSLTQSFKTLFRHTAPVLYISFFVFKFCTF
uniref:Ubinuclein 2a n=1 Tax=Pygocentrus nattereri TaxID=42514 RepID=A0AAR2ILT0_PYGNA